MKKIYKFIKYIWYWTLGHLFGLLFYDKSFLIGRWFDGKCKGLCADGWRWVVHDINSRLLFGENKGVKFPVGHGCRVVHPDNIIFHPDDLNNFQSSGTYYQAIGKISLGKGTFIAPNVGLITANHDYCNLDKHSSPKDICIGNNCWIGMNSVILPGVVLGDHTVVGAGSVVTHSFPAGQCIIAGNPARIIRAIDSSEDHQALQ